MWLEVYGGHKLLNASLITDIQFVIGIKTAAIKFFGPNGQELWAERYDEDTLGVFEERQTRLREILRAEPWER